MDMLKNTACVLGLALLGASLGACNKNEGQGAAPSSSAPTSSAPAMGGALTWLLAIACLGYDFHVRLLRSKQPNRLAEWSRIVLCAKASAMASGSPFLCGDEIPCRIESSMSSRHR